MEKLIAVCIHAGGSDGSIVCTDCLTTSYAALHARTKRPSWSSGRRAIVYTRSTNRAFVVSRVDASQYRPIAVAHM
jgi:hypothetical protein